MLDSTMGPSERDELGRLLSVGPRLVLRAGDVFDGGDFAGAALLFVEAGIVVIASAARPKRRILLGLCSAGTLLPPPQPNEQLVAIADAAVISLGREALRSLLQLPVVASAIVDSLLEALRERQESLAQFANVIHAERVRGKLLQLARTHGTVVADGVRLDLPLTHELLGQAVGSARETVTSSLGKLEREGFLIRDSGRYRLAISPEILGEPGFAEPAKGSM